MFWPNSTVYHATGKHLHGPFTVQNSIGKGHNPEAFVMKDGRIVVYVIDGYYISDSTIAFSRVMGPGAIQPEAIGGYLPLEKVY